MGRSRRSLLLMGLPALLLLGVCSLPKPSLPLPKLFLQPLAMTLTVPQLLHSNWFSNAPLGMEESPAYLLLTLSDSKSRSGAPCALSHMAPGNGCAHVGSPGWTALCISTIRVFNPPPLEPPTIASEPNACLCRLSLHHLSWPRLMHSITPCVCSKSPPMALLSSWGQG